MKESQKIHILSQELIVMFDDLENEAQAIIVEHIDQCNECSELYKGMKEDFSFSPAIENEEIIKPFKKLIHFQNTLKTMFITIRIALLLLIIYTSFSFYDWELSAQAAIEYIKYTIFLFYFPSIIFLNLFNYIFFTKRWLSIFLIFDLIVILFLDTIISTFI